MTKVAIWCRHEGDNIIGVGADIPWCVPSDSKRFRNITKEQTLQSFFLTKSVFLHKKTTFFAKKRKTPLSRGAKICLSSENLFL